MTNKNYPEDVRVRYNKSLVRFRNAVEFYNDPKESEAKKQRAWKTLTDIMREMDKAAKILDRSESQEEFLLNLQRGFY